MPDQPAPPAVGATTTENDADPEDLATMQRDMQRVPHRVAVLAVPPVTAFDLSIPELVFGAAQVDGAAAYEVRICTPEPGLVESLGSLKVQVPHGLGVVTTADTVIVTGTGARSDADPRVVAALRQAAAAGARVASICTGAFVLAHAGLLDGRRATTYWPFSAELAERFPRVDVVGDVLFVEDGVFTAAGLAAGTDLCLHLIRSDHGAAVAGAVSRLTLLAPTRLGDQAQVVTAPVPSERAHSLAGTRAWALDRLHEPLTLGELAAHAHTSVRTLTRRFQAETGHTPLQWLLEQRVDRARELLETTDLPVERVAERSGLGSADSLRRHLLRRIALTPTAYREQWQRSRRQQDGTQARRAGIGASV